METSELSRSGSVSAAQRHGRNVSHGTRTPLARRSTKGPLDTDDSLAPDPLSTPSTKEAAAIPIPPTPATARSTTLSPDQPLASRPRSRSPRSPSLRDFSFLRRPENFHSLPPNELLPPRSQPPPSTSLPDLLSKCYYRPAAILAAATLSRYASLEPPTIFSLWYTRLACLTLINHTPLAAQESLILGDIHSAYYLGEEGVECILPWGLRVLTVRLQNLGTKGQVQGYYDLAAYARQHLKSTADRDKEARGAWSDRLRNLGYRVGNALVEMGDLAAGRRHFGTLLHAADDRQERVMLGTWIAMLGFRMGDLANARKYIDDKDIQNDSSEDGNGPVLRALLSMAEGNYSDAAAEWQCLLSNSSRSQHAVVARQNLAVCLLYTGKMNETRAQLEALVEEGYTFRALTFNLATVYELSTERSREKKVELARRVGEMVQPAKQDSGLRINGRERSKEDFKLG